LSIRRGEFDPPRGRRRAGDAGLVGNPSSLFACPNGTIVQPGEHCFRTAGIGVRLPVAPPLLFRPSQRGACLVCRRRRVQFSRAARRKGETGWNNLKRASSKGRATVFQTVDAGSIPAARFVFCGGSSVVESERAKLGMGVRFSSTALGVWFHEPDLWRGTWSAKPRSRVRFSVGSPLERKGVAHALDAHRKGGRLLNGSWRVRLPPRALGSIFDSAMSPSC
jgi:hypothetical protein